MKKIHRTKMRTISVGVANRSILNDDGNLPDGTNPNDLTHVVTVTDSSKEVQSKTIGLGGGTVSFSSLAIGPCTIVVEGFLDGKLKTRGETSVNINPGTNATVPVQMGMVSELNPITIAAIPGVTVPAAGEIPVTKITETAQYTGTVTWSPVVSSAFASSTVYTATITLVAKTGYTLQCIAANFFTVAGATSTNETNSGVVTAVFPSTIPAGSIPDNPVLKLENRTLGKMTEANSGWHQLLQEIAEAGLYVSLDLSACTMTGTEFNPDYNISK